MKTLTIKTDKQEFFIKYLLLFNELFKLRTNALYVFARLLYWNDKYEYMEAEERQLVVFNTITRSKILQSLDMSRASLDNQFTYLRKKGFLINGNTINPKYEIYYSTHKDTNILFVLEEDGE